MEYRFTGIMLRKREIGETDRFYTFFSREQGKVTAIAKGVRKAEAKLASSLETATLAEIMVARTRGTGKITGAVLEESYPALHHMYEALRDVICFFTDVDHFVEAEERDEELFLLLRDYLDAVERAAVERLPIGRVRLLTEAAYYRLFVLLGYQLELKNCTVSHERLRAGERFFLSFESGGIVSAGHIGTVRDAWPVSENVIKVLRLIVSGSLTTVSKLVLDVKTLGELSRIRSDYRRFIHDK